ncbi:DUF547 domain-containing protein [uncultured Erythrobacter sp.]|uniref:DUF547 domain-containing protein n=1 Tax=uncultured Erythrobacter sp. TaxID=263913 RepID=UPI00261DC676|nr:DUF547 domain-containing protein [uncultured Erythrobacter sp.]
MSLRTQRMAAGAIVLLAVSAVAATAETAPHEALRTASVSQSSGAIASPASSPVEASEPYAVFAPRQNPIEHKIDYSIWTSALSNFVISMGPPLRKKPFEQGTFIGTRRRMGHNSIYRLEGSMVAFSFMNKEVIESFAEYRRDLEGVAETLDIQSLPRNEQLAFWLNLHNVALVEQISKEWPIRQPREIEIDGVPLDDAKFITIRGISLSPKDIRTRIVFPNWKDPAVIYGFWRGEIGGPAMQREAFAASTVSNLLDRAGREFANSRRGVENRGKTLHVSQLYEEAAPFYFPNFGTDLREHLLDFANEDVRKKIGKTREVKATLREHDIADLAGGARGNAFFANGRIGPGVADLLRQRQQKFEYVERQGIRTGTVTFTNIDLPGDAPDKGEVQ